MTAPATLAASTLCASRRPLPEALDALRELGFEAVDLPLHQGWAHVDPAALADGPGEVTAQLVDDLAELRVVALNAGTGTTDPDEELRRVVALVRLARALGAPVVTLPSGPLDGPGVEDDVARVGRFVRAAEEEGVHLTLETHRFTHWEDPRTVARYVQEVPSLGITLDPSHFTTGPHADLGFAELLPAVRHVHLRAAGTDWSQIQLPAGEGVLDVPALLEALTRIDYRGSFAVEYVDTIAGVDHVRETARMADLARTHWKRCQEPGSAARVSDIEC